jgi:hypothetical protein
MEPRREQPKAPTLGAEVRPKRFRIVKLEERIAPGGGHGNGSNATQCHTGCYGCASYICGGTTLSIE